MKKRKIMMLLASSIMLTQPLSVLAESNTGTIQETNRKPDGEIPPAPPEGMPGGPGGPAKPDGEPPAGMPGGPGGRGQQEQVEGQLGSWSMGGTDASTAEGDDYAYDSALYITADGIDEEKSTVERITAGSYDDTAASGITVDDSESGHNGILVYDTEYTIDNANISLMTDADGSDTCDFSGKGSAISVFGKNGVVDINGSTIHTAGVATMPVFADDGATVTIRNSTLQSDGGTLNSEYMNTPSQGLMVAPPWILGIMGTSRCTNIMGHDTTMNVIDADTSSGAWAVLSTDAGQDMALNVYNTSLTLNNADESEYPLQEEGGEISETKDNPYTVNYGSGYGTYAIGDAVETFAGADINVGTYATIFTGGSALYTALEKDTSYELKNVAGDTTAEYTATEDKVTTINSDTFGFMVHQNANSITLEKGTIVNSGYATFLVKSGSSNETVDVTIDDTEIKNGGVLIQVMDNDDTTNGGMLAVDDELNTNGGSQNFIPYHTEDDGFNTEDAVSDGTIQKFTFTNGEYSGNIYNASGSDGLSATTVELNLGSGAVLNGAVAQTSAIHVTYDGSTELKNNGCYAFDNSEDASTFAEKYQNSYFTINEYYDLGHVANLVNDNGANDITVTLSGDAVWNVTGTSLLSAMEISDDAQVIIPEGTTLMVDGKAYTDCILTSESF